MTDVSRPAPTPSLYTRTGKRALDLLLVAAALPMALPLMGLLAVAVRLCLGTPVVFCQVRPGRGERPFRLYKFRTMTDACGADGQPLSDHERLTPFGRWLRSTSLDELPELLNILRGDMSLVGPRPLLMEYLPRYSEEQRRRHVLRPGLTGLAQVNGRNATSWATRLAWDVRYVDQCSLSLDIRIVAQTLRLVLTREGVMHSEQTTMDKFQGL